MHQLAYNTAPYMADSRSASPHVPLAFANGAPFVRALVLAFLAYSLLAAVAAWPLLRDSGTHIASDAGDPILNTSIVVWNAKTLPYTQAWWTAPHFHPATDTTTFTENLLGVYPLSSPIYWLTGNGLQIGRAHV